MLCLLAKPRLVQFDGNVIVSSSLDFVLPFFTLGRKKPPQKCGCDAQQVVGCICDCVRPLLLRQLSRCVSHGACSQRNLHRAKSVTGLSIINMAAAAQLRLAAVAGWRGRNQRSCSMISCFVHATVWCLATTAMSQPAEAILGDILNPGGGGGGGAAITVSVSAPSTVSLCEAFLSVDASSTVSPTGATLSYDWSVSGDVVSSIAINAALALLPSSASGTAQLSCSACACG